MTLVEAALRRLESDLGIVGARWALIGGLAVGIRAEPRNTRDVDVAVSVAGDRDAERIVFALQARGYRVAAGLERIVERGFGREKDLGAAFAGHVANAGRCATDAT